jgi:hypothetical protein
MMNKRGQNLILAIIAAVMVFVAGMLFLNHIKDDVTLTRVTGLDCTNNSISDGNKLTCLGADLVVPVFILIVVSVAGGAIVSRFII